MDAKPWWKSKGAIGGLVAMAAGIVGGVDGAMQAEATEWIIGLITAGAGLAALIGRILAKRRLKI